MKERDKETEKDRLQNIQEALKEAEEEIPRRVEKDYRTQLSKETEEIQ